MVAKDSVLVILVTWDVRKAPSVLILENGGLLIVSKFKKLSLITS